MPNIKIYIDEARFDEVRPAVADMLPGLRTLVCDRLKVDVSACQIAVVPVLAMTDQPAINVEFHILPRADRSREVLRDLAIAVRECIGNACDLTVAVRIATLDPASYVAMK